MVRWMAKILLILRLLVCHVTEAELTEALDELMRTVSLKHKLIL